MSTKQIGNIILFLLWLPFLANSIDTYLDITVITNKIIQITWIFSIIFSFKYITQKDDPPFLKQLLYFFLFLLLYGVAHFLFGDDINLGGRVVPKIEYLIGIISSITPIFLIYYLSQKKILDENLIRRWSLLFIIAALLSGPNSVNKILNASDASNAEIIVKNIGYKFLHVVPFILFWYKKPLLQYLLFLILGAFIINALKRGPIVIWFILFLVFVFQNFKKKRDENIMKKPIQLMLPLLSIVFAYFYFTRVLVFNDSFFSRLYSTLEGNDSGRSEIYKSLWDIFCNHSNTFQMLFGHGAESTLNFIQIHAHNDWLELLINQGLIGVVFYILYYLKFWQQTKNTTDLLGKNLMLLLLIICFMSSLFSMSYMAFDTSIHICLGYALYRYQTANNLCR